MGSLIDERYRLLLIEHYLEDAKEVPFYGAFNKWVFVCPFCGPHLAVQRPRRNTEKQHSCGMLLNTHGYSLAPRKGV